MSRSGFAGENSESKTDNFKVQTEECTERCGPTQTAIKVCKFFDLDTDGSRGPDEVGITPWLMTLLDSTGLVTLAEGQTDAVEGCVTFGNLEPGTYFVQEQEPTGWVQTGPQDGDPLQPVNPVGVVVTEDVTSLVDFGNVCLGAGGGKTKGFWQGPNGQAVFTTDDLTAMVALPPGRRRRRLRPRGLRHLQGLDQECQRGQHGLHAVGPAGGHAPQRAPRPGLGRSARVRAPTWTESNAAGFISISQLVTLADAALAADGSTPDGDANRQEQEDLKDALDDANNNLIFVQSGPESCPGGFTWVKEARAASPACLVRGPFKARGLQGGSGR